MTVLFSTYLIPPIISIVTALYIAAMGIYRVRLKPENAMLSLLCLLWTLLPASYLIQQFMVDRDRIFMLERLTHMILAWFPLAHILFFHLLLKIRNSAMVWLSFAGGVFFTACGLTPWYITGLYPYPWGYFAKAGPLFFLFFVFCLVLIVYVIRLIDRQLRRETNMIVAMKIRYARLSFISASLITMVSALAMTGHDVYPPGYFVFLPLGFLGYGILRYRILGSRSMIHLTLLWLLTSSVTILPNVLVFILIRPALLRLPMLWMFLLLLGWFIVTFHFVIRVQRLINRLFNTVGHNLKKAETLIPRDILFLKNIDELVDEFKGLAVRFLGFNEADLFLSGPDDGVFDNRRGRTVVLSDSLQSWLKDYNHMIDCHMVGTHPRFETVRNDLLGLLGEQSSQFMVPLVQHGTLLGLAFFKDAAPNRLMLRDEIRFVDRLAETASIALFNSMVFEAMSALKNQLEDKTLKLSEEICERRKAEEEIKRSRERYKLLADNVKDTIWVLRAEDLTFSYMSPSVRHLLGYGVDEVMTMTLDRVLTPESMAYVLKLRDEVMANGGFEGDETLTLELEHVRKDGSRVWVEVATHALNGGELPLRMIGVSRDITERKKAEIEKQALESRLAQAQKMESIGVLAGGIAHDFNNILMAILGYTQLARIYIPEDNTAAQEKLARIEKAGNRAKGMVAQILAFSRQGATTKLSVQMGPIIKEAMNLLKASLPSTISLKADFEDNVPSVMADPVQIHQVVINLCSNAAHAMEDRGGECLISLSRYRLSQDEASDLNLPPGLYALLSVSDTGRGMDRKIFDKIFDPYFTTKEVGKGTGMGLAVVHGIITGCGGRIRVDSTLGKGTRFDLLFPAAESPVKSPMDPEDTREVRGKERVLFVDDEKDIREFAQECLGGLGFQVRTAEDGLDALTMLKADRQAVDIVVTDLTMPHMTGEQLASEIQRVRPGLPVILCTGYNAYLPAHHADDSGIVDILIKPVPGKDLAEAIRQALDARPQSV